MRPKPLMPILVAMSEKPPQKIINV
jgi:hypothetical protein